MNEKILIVDDDAEILQMCSDSLIEESYQIVTSSTGEEALKIARRDDFAVVLSDIRMPGMNGLELLEQLRQNDPHQIIVMFSGFGDVDAAVEAMKRGAFDYLSKPLILDELKVTIRMALQQNALYAENRRLKQELNEKLRAQKDTSPTIPLLTNLPQDVIKTFLDMGMMQTYDEQEIILQEGNIDHKLYLLFDGEVSVRQEGVELYRLGKFDSYGEMHIFRPNLSTQCLTAQRPTTVLLIEKDDIVKFFSQKEEKLFKHYILNTLNAVYLKLRRTSSRINQLERVLRR